MTKKQKNKLIDDLFEFCEKVAKGKATNEKEIEILPRVAELLLDYPITRPDDDQTLS